jgi:hypothetical protein
MITEGGQSRSAGAMQQLLTWLQAPHNTPGAPSQIAQDNQGGEHGEYLFSTKGTHATLLTHGQPHQSLVAAKIILPIKGTAWLR